MEKAADIGFGSALQGRWGRSLFGSRSGRRQGMTVVCTICGHHGAPLRHLPGSREMECALWMLLLVPGLCYRLWRMESQRRVCASCGADHVVAPDSPLGRRLLMAQDML